MSVKSKTVLSSLVSVSVSVLDSLLLGKILGVGRYYIVPVVVSCSVPSLQVGNVDTQRLPYSLSAGLPLHVVSYSYLLCFYS